MQYRRFGKSDWNVSALGFGCMRLPIINGEGGRIDEPQATRMLHYAIDHGVNYLDTAYPYHAGNSEGFIGRALQGGYRERVRLATKMPSWDVKTAGDFDRYLDEQMARLQVDYLDYYLLHSLNKDWWTRLRDLGVTAWAERAIAAGRIGNLGFSFHDSYEVFQEIVDAYDGWALCQIQYNLMDVENQAGMRGLQYAAAKGLAVVIMEPLRGGKLVNPPLPVQAIWDSAAVRRTPIEWALHWLWNQPEVSLVLSGMSTMDQVLENIAVADESRVGLLAQKDESLFERVRAQYQQLIPISCTGCRYCMPCPNGVDIPGNLAAYNEAVMYDKPDAMRGHYEWLHFAYAEQGIYDHDVRAAMCVQCGLCEEKCPQHIPISEWMPVVHEVLGEGQPLQLNLGVPA